MKYELNWNQDLRLWEVKNKYRDDLVVFRTCWFEQAEKYIIWKTI